MTSIRAVHRFLPVGQGLFVTGSVEFWPPPPKRRRNIDLGGHSGPPPLGPYRWVYDCGSSTNKRLVTNGIESVKADCGDDRLDLLTLSHFHSDHINGVVELLNKVGTKTIMLPWAPLWHRLVIGFEQGLQAGDAEMLFYVDPVAYLSQEAGDGFERVLFVMPSDEDGPPFLTDPDVPTPPIEGSEDREKDDGPGELASPEELDVSDRGVTWRVKKLRPGHAIAVHGVWEFVPYNDPSTLPHDPLGFAAVVHTYRSVLLNGSPDERKGALQKLRSNYEATFGRTSMNNVSLMLYGGAVGFWRGQRFCDCDHPIHRFLDHCGCWKEQDTKGAILMTGDGNLNSAQKWGSLERYLSVKRAKRTYVFQVAHHGARANWHAGLAALAAPVTSVFSSDPRHSYGHPHAEVLRDFWPFRPVQVDQHAGYSIRIFLER